MVRTDLSLAPDRLRFGLDPRRADTEQREAMREHAWTRMPTAIYQDAVSCARAVPAALVFCHGGISHSGAERVAPDRAGVKVPVDAIPATAGLVTARLVTAGSATTRGAARG